jgi:hypothetical protein
MKKFIFPALFGLVALIFGSPPAFGQDRYQAGGRFILGYPQGEFKQNVDSTGLGGDFYFAYHLPNSLFSVGVSVGFLIYGSETRAEPLSPTIPDVIVDVTTTNSILLCHLFLRLQPRTGRFRPYLDGLVGFNYLTTDTSIHDHDGWDEEDITSNNYNDLAPSFGAGAGAMITVVEIRTRERGRRVLSVDLDLGVRYLRGGEAEYLREGSIRRGNGSVRYDVYRSRTDLLKVCLGLAVSF